MNERCPVTRRHHRASGDYSKRAKTDRASAIFMRPLHGIYTPFALSRASYQRANWSSAPSVYFE